MSNSLALAMAVKRRMGKKKEDENLPMMADGGEAHQPAKKKEEPMYSDDGGAFKHARFDSEKMDAAQKSMNKAFKFAKGGIVHAIMTKRMDSGPKAHSMRLAEGGMVDADEAHPDDNFLTDEEQTPYFHENEDDLEPKKKDRIGMLDAIMSKLRNR